MLAPKPILKYLFLTFDMEIEIQSKKKPEQMNGAKKKLKQKNLWNKWKRGHTTVFSWLCDIPTTYFYIQYARNMQSLYEHLKHTALIVSSLHVSIIILFIYFFLLWPILIGKHEFVFEQFLYFLVDLLENINLNWYSFQMNNSLSYNFIIVTKIYLFKFFFT